MKISKANILLAIVLLAILGAIGFAATRQKPKLAAENESKQNTENLADVPDNANVVQDENIYFGLGWEGKYNLVNINTGKSQTFLPSGYTLISQYSYDAFPSYLILEKDSDLYVWSATEDKTTNIFKSQPNLKMNANEDAFVYPSITEQGKFFIQIEEYDPIEEPGMGGPTPIKSRTYTYDVRTAKLVSSDSFNPNSLTSVCKQYDSKNNRFFGWLCGEGIGHSVPLSIYSLAGIKQKEVITSAEFGVAADDVGATGVQYNDGMFYAMNKGAISKIITLDPHSANPTKETYTVSDKVSSQMKDVYAYSVAIDRANKVLVIGGDHEFDLLRYDDNKQVNSSTKIAEPEVYANFFHVHDGKLYYKAKDKIRVVNLVSGKVEKTIPNITSEEITLFNLRK